MASTKVEPKITSDVVRAYAEAMDSGFTGSIIEFAASDAGQAAATAMVDQRNAELRSVRMSWARAVARDFKINGKLTTYSSARAQSLLAYLGTVDFASLPDPETATEDEASDTADATE